MRHTFVVAEEDVEGRRAEGDTALEKVVLGAHTGSQLLEQHVTRYAPGRSLPRGQEGRDELLYVVSGAGTLELEGEQHELEPDSGVYVRAGRDVRRRQRRARRAAARLDDRPGRAGRTGRRGRSIVRFADRPELRADAKRTFRYLVNQDAGCMDATQFVGIVEPCRAPDHSHTYDELGYIVEGEGFAHIGGESIPLRPAPASTCRPSRCTASRTRARA